MFDSSGAGNFMKEVNINFYLLGC